MTLIEMKTEFEIKSKDFTLIGKNAIVLKEKMSSLRPIIPGCL